jgi:hypothetical protein
MSCPAGVWRCSRSSLPRPSRIRKRLSATVEATAAVASMTTLTAPSVQHPRTARLSKWPSPVRGVPTAVSSLRPLHPLYDVSWPSGGKEVAYLFDGASGDNLWEDRHMGARRLADVASTSGRS